MSMIPEEPATPAATLAAPAAGGEPEAVLRVLTVNTHKGFSFLTGRFVLHELREAVRAVRADVVFLQEVQGEHRGHSSRVAAWPDKSHYEFIADQIWPAFAYGRNAVYPKGHHGNALLSKYPIEEYRNHDVSIGSVESRGMLHCTLRLPHREARLHAICVHLGLQEAHRRRQLNLLCDIVRQHVPEGRTLVVAGDFNDWRRRAHAILERCAGLREVFVQAHGRAAKTFPAHLPLLQLDRIYVRNARRQSPIALPRRPWSRLSDHVPIAAEIAL